MVKGAARTHALWTEESSRRSPRISRLGGLQIALAFRLYLHDHGLKTSDHFGGTQGLTPVTCGDAVASNSFSRAYKFSLLGLNSTFRSMTPRICLGLVPTFLARS